MVQYVVDASVLIQGYIREQDTPHVLTLIKLAFDTQQPVLHVPEFCLLECTNILWKRARFHKAGRDETEEALANLTATPLVVQPVIDLLPRILAIGLQHSLAIYDSSYIALAEHLGYRLITVDKRQTQVASQIGVEIEPLSSFPAFQP